MINIICCKCSIVFGVPNHWYNKRREDHKSFSCPNGHSQHFGGKSNIEKLKSDLRWQETRNFNLNNRLEFTKKSRNSYKGHLARIKKGITNDKSSGKNKKT